MSCIICKLRKLLQRARDLKSPMVFSEQLKGAVLDRNEVSKHIQQRPKKYRQVFKTQHK